MIKEPELTPRQQDAVDCVAKAKANGQAPTVALKKAKISASIYYGALKALGKIPPPEVKKPRVQKAVVVQAQPLPRQSMAAVIVCPIDDIANVLRGLGV